MSVQTINPHINKAVKSSEEMTKKTVDAKVAKAKKAFAGLKETSYEQRADLLHNVATLMKIKKSELAKTIALEIDEIMAHAEGEIDLANDSDFGLGASIFKLDIESGKRIANQINTGMVFINHPTWMQTELPLGGTKNSGFGRQLYELRIQECIYKKLIRISNINDPF